jgi:hypothetical protein
MWVPLLPRWAELSTDVGPQVFDYTALREELCSYIRAREGNPLGAVDPRSRSLNALRS